MRAYENTAGESGRGMGLVLERDGTPFRLRVLHATVGQRLSCGTEKRMTHARHSHQDVYHVLLFTEGDTDFIFDGRRTAARRGTLALSQPGNVHNFAPAAPGTVGYSQITFGFFAPDGRTLSLPFHELLGLYAGVPVVERDLPALLDEPRTAEVMAAINRIMDGLERRGGLGNLRAQQRIGDLLAYLTERVYSPARTPEPIDRGETPLAAARSHIEAHYREKISVAALARISHLSPGHFLRSFKKRYGISPIAYQGQLRVDAAGTLLRFTGLSCKEIAARLGYCDAYHFSKSFRKLTGRAPTACRG